MNEQKPNRLKMARDIGLLIWLWLVKPRRCDLLLSTLRNEILRRPHPFLERWNA